MNLCVAGLPPKAERLVLQALSTYPPVRNAGRGFFSPSRVVATPYPRGGEAKKTRAPRYGKRPSASEPRLCGQTARPSRMQQFGGSRSL